MTTTTRYLVLTTLRWLPVGFTIPISILLPVSRGLSLSEVGLAFAAQGLLVLCLELPTGGLSDSWGRRPVLLLGSAFGIAASTMLVVADSFPTFVLVWALQGVFRALDSGPLEAWYVDATLAANPDAALEKGLSSGGAALSIAVASGALISGALVALDPPDGLNPLTLPAVIALGLVIVSTIGVATLMTEQRPRDTRLGVRDSIRAVPAIVRQGVGLLRGNRVLLALVSVELFWGFGMVSFENLTSVRLAELTDGPNAAAALMGPVTSGAWVTSALGAATIVLLSGRIGVASAAIILRLLQAGAVVAMGLVGGPAGLVVAFLAAYCVHGASNPLHMTLLHREVTGEHRSTVISVNSMAAMPASALGVIVLTALADRSSIAVSIVVGGVVLALAAPLYLPARRREQHLQLASQLDTTDVSTSEAQARKP
ncbi:Major facilitator transporter [Nostocoides australiense Ben110]|uniref:Major facilitator transporter n=1 Tax=Nostocoides australiense Ben110 TaxID=1193182 RepID=W6JTD4_9MICO|nr:MFS transporter [Tetrasphaera australiensis]CCH72553.1 Major facilitator transporter [Tetrasphaera australiensis Ben110]